MTTPTYKLYYFNLRGRAETARMLFKLAGQDFEDIRLDQKKDWPEFKSKTPMGLLPVLDVDGTMICESNAIARYLAREFGYAGEDSLAMARADMIVDSIVEIIQKCMPIYAVETEEEKAVEKKKFLEESIEPGFAKLQALLEQNNGGDGYFVGKELTVADLVFLTHADFALTLTQTDLSKFPKLQALVKRVEAIPKIAAWIKERPVTEF